MLGDKEPPNASEEFLGLARICYEWNDLEAAEHYAQQSVELARQYDPAIVETAGRSTRLRAPGNYG